MSIQPLSTQLTLLAQLLAAAAGKLSADEATLARKKVATVLAGGGFTHAEGSDDATSKTVLASRYHPPAWEVELFIEVGRFLGVFVSKVRPKGKPSSYVFTGAKGDVETALKITKALAEEVEKLTDDHRVMVFFTDRVALTRRQKDEYRVQLSDLLVRQLDQITRRVAERHPEATCPVPLDRYEKARKAHAGKA